MERLKEAPTLLKDVDMTTFPQCMPDECKAETPEFMKGPKSA